MALHSRGMIYMLLATFFFALMSLLVKLLPGIPVLEIIFFRAVISLSLCFYGFKRAKISPWGNNKTLLTIRGCAGTLSLIQGYFLVQSIPLAAATTLTHLSPIFTALIGIWFVREKVTPLQLAFFGLSFLGVVMIQGFDYRINIGHLLLGITTSLTMGIAYNCVRKLGSTEHPLVIIFYFPLVCLPFSAVWCALYWVQPQGTEWLYLILLGLTTQFGQYFMTRAYQVAAISRVAIINYTEIIFAILFGLLLFAENYNLLTYAGMALVVSGVIMNMIYRQKAPVPEPKPMEGTP
ncbi:MAG: DMT family transporter [Pseudomonadota bacterium]